MCGNKWLVLNSYCCIAIFETIVGVRKNKNKNENKINPKEPKNEQLIQE